MRTMQLPLPLLTAVAIAVASPLASIAGEGAN